MATGGNSPRALANVVCMTGGTSADQVFHDQIWSTRWRNRGEAFWDLYLSSSLLVCLLPTLFCPMLISLGSKYASCGSWVQVRQLCINASQGIVWTCQSFQLLIVAVHWLQQHLLLTYAICYPRPYGIPCGAAVIVMPFSSNHASNCIACTNSEHV
jgi:hypothetical protein